MWLDKLLEKLILYRKKTRFYNNKGGAIIHFILFPSLIFSPTVYIYGKANLIKYFPTRRLLCESSLFDVFVVNTICWLLPVNNIREEKSDGLIKSSLWLVIWFINRQQGGVEGLKLSFFHLIELAHGTQPIPVAGMSEFRKLITIADTLQVPPKGLQN